MVLSDEDLRVRPAEMMTSVWQFLGFAPFNLAGVTKADVYKRYSAVCAHAKASRIVCVCVCVCVFACVLVV